MRQKPKPLAVSPTVSSPGKPIGGRSQSPTFTALRPGIFRIFLPLLLSCCLAPHRGRGLCAPLHTNAHTYVHAESQTRVHMHTHAHRQTQSRVLVGTRTHTACCAGSCNAPPEEGETAEMGIGELCPWHLPGSPSGWAVPGHGQGMHFRVLFTYSCPSLCSSRGSRGLRSCAGSRQLDQRSLSVCTGRASLEKQVGWSEEHVDAMLSFSFILSDGSAQVVSLLMVKDPVMSSFNKGCDFVHKVLSSMPRARSCTLYSHRMNPAHDMCPVQISFNLGLLEIERDGNAC